MAGSQLQAETKLKLPPWKPLPTGEPSSGCGFPLLLDYSPGADFGSEAVGEPGSELGSGLKPSCGGKEIVSLREVPH